MAIIDNILIVCICERKISLPNNKEQNGKYFSLEITARSHLKCEINTIIRSISLQAMYFLIAFNATFIVDASILSYFQILFWLLV